jgi:hypothetical protein
MQVWQIDSEMLKHVEHSKWVHGSWMWRDWEGEEQLEHFKFDEIRSLSCKTLSIISTIS